MKEEKVFSMNENKLAGLSEEEIKRIGFRAGVDFVKKNLENFQISGAIYLRGFLEGMEYQMNHQLEPQNENNVPTK
jgi:hypothetical protein